MIIGYYEEAYFDGGKYIKICQNEDDKYNIEWIYSKEPNYIPEADAFIKIKESILCSNEFLDFFDKKQLCTELKEKEDEKVKHLIEYINSINLNKISRHKYDAKNVEDGTDWELFIELKGKEYYINGYERKPKQIIEILEYIEKIINENVIDEHFEIYINEIAKKIKNDINFFQKIILIITQNSKIHHWGFCLYIRNNYIYNDDYLMGKNIDPDELSDIIIKKVVKTK